MGNNSITFKQPYAILQTGESWDRWEDEDCFTCCLFTPLPPSQAAIKNSPTQTQKNHLLTFS